VPRCRAIVFTLGPDFHLAFALTLVARSIYLEYVVHIYNGRIIFAAKTVLWRPEREILCNCDTQLFVAEHEAPCNLGSELTVKFASLNLAAHRILILIPKDFLITTLACFYF
jgi:hypothetical protein